MTLELNRAMRAKLHVAVLDALGDDNGQRAAFAEAIAWADSGEIADLGTLFNLAEAIAFCVDQHVYRSDCQYAEVSAEDLREVYGAQTVNLALKLAGILPRQRGRSMIWSDSPSDGRTRAVPVTLPADLLETWNSK